MTGLSSSGPGTAPAPSHLRAAARSASRRSRGHGQENCRLASPSAPWGITQLSPSFKAGNRSLKAARAFARWLILFLISGPSWAMVAAYSGTQKTGS